MSKVRLDQSRDCSEMRMRPSAGVRPGAFGRLLRQERRGVRDRLVFDLSGLGIVVQSSSGKTGRRM